MKISMVMPIYNEAKLLPYHLELAAPFVDEVILIDGSPTGPSTDGTKDLIKKYDNVVRIEGKFELPNRKNGWDKASQLKAGIKKATGDMIILTSVDSVYSDYELLVNTIKEHPDGKVFYCFLTEFFLDTKHIRLIMTADYPAPQVGYGIFPKKLFTTKEATWYATSMVEPIDYIFLQDIRKFHYGWITDFDAQIAKHIRNVKSGWWAEYGEKILSAGEQTIDAWAITHVIHYEKEGVFVYAGNEYHPFHQIEFDYRNNFEKVMMEFKKKYKKDYYECI